MANFCSINSLWDELPEDAFEQAIIKAGWRKIAPTSWKKVYSLDNVVMKFDSPKNTESRNNHTGYEWRVWQRTSPYKRRFFAKCLGYHNGLLFQEKLEIVCEKSYCECEYAKSLGHKLRIMDWMNHGWIGDRLKFFDYDGMGSGWYNWKKA